MRSAGTSALAVAPAGLVLLAASAAERLDARSATFYLCLLGIPVASAGALLFCGRLVDAASAGASVPLAQAQALVGTMLVVLFVAAAAARSPLWLEREAPGLAPAAIGLGLVLVGVQALLALVAFVAEPAQDVRLDRRLLALDADSAERLDARAVR